MAFPAAVPLLAALGPWISRFFMAKGALMFAGFLGRIGLVLATNEVLVEPAIQAIDQAWGVIPSSARCWVGVFGLDKAASIFVSALSVLSVQRVFFSKG